MSAAQDGGPAFPQMLSRLQYDDEADIHRTMIDSTGGMSLRDYFAGQALVALIGSKGYLEMECSFAAEDAYIYADAMLKARQ